MINFLLTKLLNFILSLQRTVFGFLGYFNDYYVFAKMNDNRLALRFRDIYPIFGQAVSASSFDTHYVYHTAWAARVLASTKPLEHIDIGSCLRFVSITSAFIPFKFYDFRPPDLKLSNLKSEHANIISLPFDDFSIKSLSCMHTVEHIGLGRYGDPIDPDGDLKAIAELQRVLAPEGDLLFVVPIGGTGKIMFNAHRIYTYKEIREYFKELNLCEFSLITDIPNNNGLVLNASEELANKCDYGCGCFWFKNE